MCAFFILMLPSVVKLSVHCSFLLHNSIIESLFPHPCVVIILVMYGEGNEASAHLPRGHIQIHQYHAINMSFSHLSSHHKNLSCECCTSGAKDMKCLQETQDTRPQKDESVALDYMLVKRINFSIRRTQKNAVWMVGIAMYCTVLQVLNVL